MTYELKFLSDEHKHELYVTFMEAFSDYIVQGPSRASEEKLLNRFKKNGVDYKSSVGAYHEGKLVGFTVVALDEYCGSYSAYDAATGIIKPHRGKGLAKSMFEFALPNLRAKGVKRFYLEAIQANEPAVRAYKKTGFSIARELDSFQLDFKQLKVDLTSTTDVAIRPITLGELDPLSDFFDWPPSWEKSLNSLQRIPDEVLCLGAFHEGTLAGALVHYPAANWIMTLAVDKSLRRQKLGSALLVQLKETISDEFATTKIINVDHSDVGMIDFLRKVGFEPEINQYEMKLDL